MFVDHFSTWKQILGYFVELKNISSKDTVHDICVCNEHFNVKRYIILLLTYILLFVKSNQVSGNVKMVVQFYMI